MNKSPCVSILMNILQFKNDITGVFLEATQNVWTSKIRIAKTAQNLTEH